MKGPFEEQIREWVKSGRISDAIAEALTEHYSKQGNSARNRSEPVLSQVNLMDLMNLIDLLEKRKELPRTFSPAQEPPPPKVSSLGSPEQFLHENKEEYLIPPGVDKAGPRKKKGETRLADLKKKCDDLKAELETEKKAHAESAKMEFIYAKRYADSQEESRQVQVNEGKKRKALEEENCRLGEEFVQMREREARAQEKVSGLEADIKSAQLKIQDLEKKCAVLEDEASRVEKARGETEKMLLDGKWLRDVALAEKESLAEEKRQLLQALEAKAEEEKRLLEEVRDLKSKCFRKDAEIKEKEGAAVEKQRLVSAAYEKRCLVLEEEKCRLEAERRALALELSRRISPGAKKNIF